MNVSLVVTLLGVKYALSASSGALLSLPMLIAILALTLACSHRPEFALPSCPAIGRNRLGSKTGAVIHRTPLPLGGCLW